METASFNLREGMFSLRADYSVQMSVDGDSFREKMMSYFQRACQGELFFFFKRMALGGRNMSASIFSPVLEKLYVKYI